MKRTMMSLFTVLLLMVGCSLEAEIPRHSTDTEIENIKDSHESKTSDESKNEAIINKETKKELDHSNKVEVSGDLTVHYIDVGQADATLVQFEYENINKNIMIDTGDWNSNASIDYLNHLGVSSIDLLIGTHPHSDHIGQMDNIIEQFEVTEVWMSGDISTSKVFERVIDAIELHNIDYNEPRTGENYEIGPLTIEIVNPNNVDGNLNNGSIAFKMTYGESSFMFTGDAEEEAENYMISSGLDISADVLNVGHHGSNTSTTNKFLDKVDPSIAIISAGKNNSYGHPHESTVNKIKDKGIDLYSTHINGTVIIETNGDGKYKTATNKDGNVTTSKAEVKKASNKTGGKPKIKSKENGFSNQNAAGDCVDINLATLEDLQQIKHIGPSRAQDLIENRPYNSIEDLNKINGIGPARISDIKDQKIACVK